MSRIARLPHTRARQPTPRPRIQRLNRTRLQPTRLRSRIPRPDIRRLLDTRTQQDSTVRQLAIRQQEVMQPRPDAREPLAIPQRLRAILQADVRERPGTQLQRDAAARQRLVAAQPNVEQTDVERLAVRTTRLLAETFP